MSVPEPREVGAVRVAGNGHGAAPLSPAERPLPRRRNLPGSRAVVGGFLVATAAVLIFAAYSSATARPRQSYVVATRTLAPGTRLAAGDLRLAELDVPDQAVRAVLFGSVPQLVGASVVAPITAGDLVEASAVVGRGGALGTREVSMQLDRSRAVGGTLKAGEFVDVLGTFGTGSDSYTAVLVSHIQVISLSNVSSSLGDTRTQLITFAATSEPDAEAVANAGIAGQTTLIRAAEQSSDATDASTPPYRAPRASSGTAGT
jgi:Flp pilus assembly protein CpaB